MRGLVLLFGLTLAFPVVALAAARLPISLFITSPHLIFSLTLRDYGRLLVNLHLRLRRGMNLFETILVQLGQSRDILVHPIPHFYDFLKLIQYLLCVMLLLGEYGSDPV